jgi:site-specific recombinase XerD
MAELEPLAPADAQDMYLTQRESEVSESTTQAHQYRLSHFIRWCEQESIDNLNELTSRRVFEYRQWRKEDGDLNQVTLQTQLSTLRVFIRFCESIDAVTEGLAEKMMIPTLSDDEGTREGMLEAVQAQALLEHLGKFKYASTKHALVAVLWHTSCRIGGLHSLDTDDFDKENQSLAFNHRPETGTSLKNGASGERIVALSPEVASVIEDYIETNRPRVTDEYGREPLFATTGGRWHKSNIRQRIYALTRPCYYTNECPHGRDLDLCDANTYDKSSKCPSSHPPHDIRRGSITNFLKDDEIPRDAISDRANVSADVMERHYDQMTEDERMEQRRKFFE